MSEGGTIHRIHRSDGGVPKLPVDSAQISLSGVDGDRQAKPDIHGQPHQAVSLFALERIEALARDGHPIEPGSTGENVTTRGLDWDRMKPGVRLRLGTDVVLELTSYASPCRTIADSFADGRYGRLSQQTHPGWSRLYAAVLATGEIRRGDPIAILEPREEIPVMTTAPQLAYVNLYVSDLARSVGFFRDTIGLALTFSDAKFGYASFDVGPVRMGLAQIDSEDPDQRRLIGRQTGFGFAVPDLAASHRALATRGVRFTMEPSRQPWGGYMAMFEDPDGNQFYLDQTATP